MHQGINQFRSDHQSGSNFLKDENDDLLVDLNTILNW
jgi:hypothetical protein